MDLHFMRRKWEKSSMKTALLLFLISGTTWARPLVLLTFFDPFGKAPFNSSEVVGNEIFERHKNDPDYELKICKLRTVFDVSYYQFEDCLKSLDREPDLVLGLGESNCNLKIEMMGRNLDRTKGPDNDGIERNSTPIRSNGPDAIGFTYPLAEMYCSLNREKRKDVEVSNNAGSFVCNNYAYQIAYSYPELKFGFIHVPANNCKDVKSKTKIAIENLETMIKAAVTEKQKRLPVLKKQIRELRDENAGTCLGEFYNRARGFDERKIWPF